MSPRAANSLRAAPALALVVAALASAPAAPATLRILATGDGHGHVSAPPASPAATPGAARVHQGQTASPWSSPVIEQ